MSFDRHLQMALRYMPYAKNCPQPKTSTEITNLGNNFHQRANFPRFVDQAGFLGCVAAHYVRIEPDSDEQRNEKRAVLEAVASLQLQHRAGRQQARWLVKQINVAYTLEQRHDDKINYDELKTHSAITDS